MRFNDKTVLITGASLGVGRAVAKAFIREGANVALCARREDVLAEAVRALGAPDRVLAIPCDVVDLRAMEMLVAETCTRFGAIHGLVNNAGAHARGPVLGRDPSQLAAMVDVNLRAPIVLTRLVLPHIERAGGGFVVNIASLAGKLPLDGAATYSSTKFGLRAFSYAMAEELRGRGITVSAVSPGPIDTGFIMDEIDEVEDIVFSQSMCTAEDVARMTLDCAADGRVEREFPVAGGKLATLAYLVPGLRRLLKPALARKGAQAKARLKAERSS